MITTDQIAVYIGLDVGKQEHHACALDPGGNRLHDRPLPQDETRLRELFPQLADHGTVLVAVDQPASIGALPIAVAREVGAHVAYLPGLAIRRIADLHPGNAKTDARDAYVTAEAARTTPHALRAVDTGEEALADLQVIIGFDDDLAGEVTRVTNRIRGLLTQIHPALERAIGAPRHPRRPHGGMGQQTVTVPGTTAAEVVLPQLAGQLTHLLEQRKAVAAQVEEMLDAHPLSPVLTSMPGIGVRTAARILLEVGDGSSFPTAGHLAAYAGPAPATRRSGTSIRGEHPSRAGNKQFLPRSLRRPVRPHQPRLLRPQTSSRQEAQRCPDLPGPTPLRRPVRPDQRDPERSARARRRLPPRAWWTPARPTTASPPPPAAPTGPARHAALQR